MITTSLEVAFLILAVEFGLLAIAISIFLYRGARTAEAETAADATELVSKVSNTEDSRRTALETIFRDKYQYEGDELKSAVDEFMEREKAFYNAVVGAFLGRGKSKISDLNNELTKVVAPWISITPKKMLDADAAESLVAEKSGLEEELEETKQVLEKLIKEYNNAFRTELTVDTAAEVSGIESYDEEAEAADEAPLVADEAPTGGEGAAEPTPPNDVPSGIDIGEEETDEPDLVSAMGEESGEESGEELEETTDSAADKPMTADDLDDLMNSLESELVDGVETV